MKITREKAVDLPYSLHDAVVEDLRIEGQDLVLLFQEGYIEVQNDEYVDGQLRVCDVNFEDSYAYLMKFEGVNMGDFSGRKMTLAEMVETFRREWQMEILDEYDGYNGLCLTGVFTQECKIVDFVLEIYYFGHVVWELAEAAEDQE